PLDRSRKKTDELKGTEGTRLARLTSRCQGGLLLDSSVRAGARARFERGSFASSILAGIVLLLVALVAEAAPPYKYYVLAPEQLSSDLSVMSLEPGNTVSLGSIQLPLGEYARATIPAAAMVPGAVLSGTAQYSVGSSGNATDLLAPDFFAGTSFIVPHIG